MRIGALAGSALLVALVGCSSTEAGAPASPSAEPNPIPAVQDPKDISAVEPCDLLTPEQLAALGIDQPGELQNFEEISEIRGCEWQDAAGTRDFAAGVYTDADPLRNLYLYQRDSFAVFELTDIVGHPTIRTQDVAGGGTCALLVKPSDRQAFDVHFTSLGQDQAPCSEAQRIAETILSNLPPAT